MFDSIDAVDANDQQKPSSPWFFTLVDLPSSRKSYFDGNIAFLLEKVLVFKPLSSTSSPLALKYLLTLLSAFKVKVETFGVCVDSSFSAALTVRVLPKPVSIVVASNSEHTFLNIFDLLLKIDYKN